MLLHRLALDFTRRHGARRSTPGAEHPTGGMEQPGRGAGQSRSELSRRNRTPAITIARLTPPTPRNVLRAVAPMNGSYPPYVAATGTSSASPSQAACLD